MRYKLHLLKVDGELYCELVSNDLAFLKEVELTFTARGGAGPSVYYEWITIYDGSHWKRVQL